MKRPAAVVLMCAVAYLVLGVVTSYLSGAAPSHTMVVAWRLFAWVGSAVVFALHINVERHRPGTTPKTIASRAGAAVALGASGLAAAAIVHALATGTGNLKLLAFALVAWPVITAVPAFFVAWAAGLVFARRPV